MSVENLILFVLSTVGMAHLIVDANIMEWFRNFVKWASEKCKIPSFGGVVDCHLCCGTWCGFIMGLLWISYDPFKIISCGFIGGFVSNFAIILINWFESQTLASYSNYTPDNDNYTVEENKNES